MTPDTFSGAVLTLIFSSFAVERGLSVVFESRPFLARFGHTFNYKVTFAFITSLIFVFLTNVHVIDLMSESSQAYIENVITRYESEYIGKFLLTLSYIFTALIVAGGSKASLKLFRDVMSVQSLVAQNTRASSSISSETISSDATSAANGNKMAKESVFEILDKSSPLLIP